MESGMANVAPGHLHRLSWINDVHVLMVVGMDPPNALLPWHKKKRRGEHHTFHIVGLSHGSNVRT